jgi:hypothetical protein
VRPNRYALALATGMPLGASTLALHECDVPLCVKVAEPFCVRQHVVAGTLRDNMIRMAHTGRGGGRHVIRQAGVRARRARSVALRAAVRSKRRVQPAMSTSASADDARSTCTWFPGLSTVAI